MTVTYAKMIPRDGEKHVYVEAFSDDVPSPLPTVDDIPGYEYCDQIAVGSYLFIIDSSEIYIANESGTFTKQ